MKVYKLWKNYFSLTFLFLFIIIIKVKVYLLRRCLWHILRKFKIFHYSANNKSFGIENVKDSL